MTKISIKETTPEKIAGQEQKLPRGWSFGRIRGFHDTPILRIGQTAVIFPRTDSSPIIIQVSESPLDSLEVQQVEVELVVSL